MSNQDKISNKVDELAGKGKETAGRATDNPDLEAEGKGDQAKSNLKQAGEKVKGLFRVQPAPGGRWPQSAAPPSCGPSRGAAFV